MIRPPFVISGHGATDYGIAQVSVGLRDQGPAQPDPALLEMQLSHPGSNCLPTSPGGSLGNGTYFCNVAQISVLTAPTGNPQPGTLAEAVAAREGALRAMP